MPDLIKTTDSHLVTIRFQMSVISIDLASALFVFLFSVQVLLICFSPCHQLKISDNSHRAKGSAMFLGRHFFLLWQNFFIGLLLHLQQKRISFLMMDIPKRVSYWLLQWDIFNNYFCRWGAMSYLLISSFRTATRHRWMAILIPTWCPWNWSKNSERCYGNLFCSSHSTRWNGLAGEMQFQFFDQSLGLGTCSGNDIMATVLRVESISKLSLIKPVEPMQHAVCGSD